MSTGSNASTSPVYVTCPKCDGRKIIRGFSHYAGGVCFMCDGNGTVDASRAMKAAGIVQGMPTTPAHKMADCGEFGTAMVVRYGSGFRADFCYPAEESDRGEMFAMVVFDVVAGRVANAIVSDASTRRGDAPGLVAALQAALKR